MSMLALKDPFPGGKDGSVVIVKEKSPSEASSLPANILRTLPYTVYVAVGSYAILFASSGAAWLELALAVNEVLNAVFKKILRALGSPRSALLKRPDGAMDSGIYPQHYPRSSTTSGMPSGHSQASALVAVVLSSVILEPPEAAAGVEADFTWRVPDGAREHLQLAYLWLVAVLVIISRTRFAGPLGVKVDGRSIAHHTVLQVMVGGAVGFLLGLSAVSWYHRRPWATWTAAAFGLLATIALAAALEARLLEPPSSSSSSSSSSASSALSSSLSSSPAGSGSEREHHHHHRKLGAFVQHSDDDEEDEERGNVGFEKFRDSELELRARGGSCSASANATSPPAASTNGEAVNTPTGGTIGRHSSHPSLS